MTKDTYILSPEYRPDWLSYPHAFLRLVHQGIIHITPWHIMEADQAQASYQQLRERYSTRFLFPFAYRQDNDDLACWSKEAGEQVFVIHNFADPGFENEGSFRDVWAWFRFAIEETIDWD